jgi:hypothetical protein
MRSLIAVLVVGISSSGGAVARAQSPLFVPAPDSPVAVGRGSGRILLADLNRDGHLDLVTQHLLSSTLGIMSGDGKGHFAYFDGAPMRLGYQPGTIALGDLNEDGTPDLGVASRDDKSEYINILINNGRGGFKPVSRSPFTASASAKTYKPSLQLVDVNDDGPSDVVAANGRRNTVELLFGDGRGGFSRPSTVNLEPGYGNYSVAVGDIDGDKRLDLVAAISHTDGEPGRLVVMHGDGRGGFEDKGAQLPVPSGSRVGPIADLNGDGLRDVVFNHGVELAVFVNQGRGTFTPALGSPYPLGMPAYSVVVADMNQDKKPDLVVPTVNRRAPYESRVVVLLGDGRGFAIAPGSPFSVGPGAYNLAVGDVNEDGKLDIAASSFEGDGVAVLLGR